LARVAAPATPSRPKPFIFWNAMTAWVVAASYELPGLTSYWRSESRWRSVVTRSPESPGRTPSNGTVVLDVDVDELVLLDDVVDGCARRFVLCATARSVPDPPLHAVTPTSINVAPVANQPLRPFN